MSSIDCRDCGRSIREGAPCPYCVPTPEPLPVLFRVSRSAPYDVCALFPTLPGTPDGATMVCYAHIGQHSSASWAWYHSRRHRRATRGEYRALLAELRGIYERSHGPGDQVYKLVPVQRVTPAHRAAFRAALREVAS